MKTSLDNTEQGAADLYVSRKKAAAMGDCCIETIKRMEKRGQLHPHKFSARMVRYKLLEVQQAFNGTRV